MHADYMSNKSLCWHRTTKSSTLWTNKGAHFGPVHNLAKLLKHSETF